jgi:hypothetical protein
MNNQQKPVIIPAGASVLFGTPGLSDVRHGTIVESDMLGHYRIQTDADAYTYAKPVSIIAFLTKGYES